MDYVTIAGVEIVTVGMKWPASTGPVTLTLEHLADMVAAFEDPLIRAPRVKIGHTDPRFDDELPDHAVFYDGEPVFGTIANPVLVNDGAVLMADLVEVPAWLAEAAPSSYPSRSAEWVWDVETEANNTYSAVLTAVAFLGEAPPAIKDLDDLERVLASGPEELAAATEGDRVGKVAGPISARADVDKVIETFYADYAVEEDGRYWWWVRAVWTDPNELIVDDDEGSLLRVPFSSGDKPGAPITFSDPVEVNQVFVDAASGEPRPAIEHSGRPDRVFAKVDESRPPEREKKPEEGGSGVVSSVSPVDPKLLRQALGLSPEATDEEVEARIAARAAAVEADGSEQEQPTTPPQDPAAPEQTDPPETPPTSPTPAPETPPAETPPETPPPEQPPADEPPPEAATTVSVSRDVWEETQRQAREGAAAHAEHVTDRREQILDRAVKAGKITVASRDDWRKKLQTAPEATERELDELAAGLIPTDEVGSAAPPPGFDDEMDTVMATFPGGQHIRGEG